MKDWRKILVSSDTPILKALKIIDDSSMQIALVADAGNHLLGTVTDGDIRRGILKGISLESPVSQVMNPHPVTARLNDGKDNILALMKMKTLRQIPVLDEEGVVTGVQIIDELLRSPTFSAITVTNVTVSWTPPTGGANGNYKVERAPDAGGAPGTWAQVATGVTSPCRTPRSPVATPTGTEYAARTRRATVPTRARRARRRRRARSTRRPRAR